MDNNVIAGRIVSISRLKKKKTDRGSRLIKVVLDKESTEKRVLKAAPKLGEYKEGTRKIKLLKNIV